MFLNKCWLIWTGLLLLLIGFSSKLLAQKPDDDMLYKKMWDSVAVFDGQGKPKSALEEVQNIFKKVSESPKNGVQEAQYIKCLMHLSKYQAQLNEDGLAKEIYKLEQEMAKAENNQKALLMSLLAEAYNQYLSSNLYKIQSRTTVDKDYKLEDINTWDVNRFASRSYELHMSAIQIQSTKSVSLKDYASILSQMNIDIQPNLYDFLVFRALDYFASDKTYLAQPAYKFYIDAPEALADANVFVAYNFVSKDATSHTLKTVQLFQEILKYYQSTGNTKSFLQADFRRLMYMRSKSTHPEKDQQYLKTLEKIRSEKGTEPASTFADYRIAAYWMEQAAKYRPSPTDAYRWDNKKALEVCEAAIRRHPESLGATNCKSIIGNIKNPNLSIQLERVYSSNSPLLGIVRYDNVEKIYFKVVSITKADWLKYQSLEYDKQLEFLNALPVKNKFSLQLPDEKDFQSHQAEFKIDKLPYGSYVILTSTDENFNRQSGIVTMATTQISDLSLFSRNKEYNTEFFVTNRNTGAPLAGVTVEFWEEKYSYTTYRTYYDKIGSTLTDKNGYAKPSLGLFAKNGTSYEVRLVSGKDGLDLGDNFYHYKHERYKETRNTAHMFLDRAIYRPGQTIYFKGLMIRRDEEGRNPKIVANQSSTVTFMDANYQKVGELKLTTNEFGSYQGSFVAPATGLLGVMYLQDSYSGSQTTLRVEEYKRPKFEVTFNPVDKAYRLEEKVEFKGVATAFAGNKIDGAMVKYRVVRQARFPYWNWYRWGRYNPYNQSSQEITFGETQTNGEGEFVVAFSALPDRSIPADQRPNFTYTVYAEVTDVTGETRTTTGTVEVGYTVLRFGVNVPEQVNKADFKKIEFTSTNLNGQFEPAEGTFSIEKLSTPAIVYKNRYWERPDYFILTAADFGKDFPLYAYKNEDEVSNWKVEKSVLTGTFNTSKSKEFDLSSSISAWGQGTYKMVAKTKDKFGTEIETINYFTLFDQKENKVPNNELLFLVENSFIAQPGDKVNITFGSVIKDLPVLVQVEHDGKLIVDEWKTCKGLINIPLTITEAQKGGLSFRLLTTHNNRFETQSGRISVPFSDKELKISYETFRDKLLPGQDEEWKIKISGHKGDKVLAEVLAGMYDASLDAFAANNWYLSLFGENYAKISYQGNGGFNAISSEQKVNNLTKFYGYLSVEYSNINWFGLSFYEYYYNRYDELEDGDYMMNISMEADAPKRSGGRVLKKEKSMQRVAASPSAPTVASGKSAEAEEKEKAPNMDEPEAPEETDPAPKNDGDMSGVKIRTNLNETVFFFPSLQTDAEGNVIIKFKMNEALTRWKFMTFAHTKDLATAIQNKMVVTQKDLMVQPNAPRFFRQGDEIHFTAKVSNLTKSKMDGKVTLQLFNASTMQPVDAAFGNTNNLQTFSADAARSTGVSWKLKVPTDWTSAITFRAIAQSGSFSDGEESSLPVVSNRMLVTETMPLPIRGGQTKQFDFKRIGEVGKSATAKPHQLTLEFTQNPAWYAVQSLPYLMEYSYECTEQLFSRFYANSLASSIANSHPRIKSVFDQWKNTDPNALKSNLHKNQELKYALLEETPWVLNAENEAEQKKRVGLLFDLNRMSDEMTRARDKIADRQMPNGGFAWFKGDRDDWYISQYIVEGMGHLQVMGVKAVQEDAKIANMMKKAVSYIDDRIAKHYEELLKAAKRDTSIDLKKDHLDYMAIHYLYARSFFLAQKVENKATEPAVKYYEEQAQKYWLNKDMYAQGMLALRLHRVGDTKTPAAILASLKERALNNEEMGMYWKYASGYYWYQLPIETHALMIEAFEEIGKDAKVVDDLKTWLLKAKQTTHWKTTKATSAACYALLRRGDNWLLEDKEISIKMGGQVLDQSKIQKEAGTGYFKTKWEAADVRPEMAKVEITNPNKVVAWGAMYFQYFEQLDKITDFQETPLKINKQLFKEVKTDMGLKLEPILEGAKLKVGDLVKVRVEIRVDRDMEYVHMKDARASGFEPVNVLSQFKYQGGLGYYESTKDASTNFFFSYLSKGTYVFEYGLRVQHKGDFSNGITTMQCMYAPEFTSHSQGVRVVVE